MTPSQLISPDEKDVSHFECSNPIRGGEPYHA